MELSVVIPCKNEEKYIEKCVNSVLVALNGIRGEVIVVDGVSTDKTQDILKAMVTQDERLKLLVNHKGITPIGLNIGIEAAEGQFVAILGAHSEVSGSYFKEGLILLNKSAGLGCVGGVLENVFEDKVSEYIGKSMSSSFGVGNAYFRTGARSGEVDTVAFGIYPQRVFEIIGLFDEGLPRNQDDEFNYRVKRAGFKIFLSTEMCAKYYVRGNFRKLYRQYYQYGFWKVKVNVMHSAITTFRQMVPPLFVTWVLFGAIGSFLSMEVLVLYLFGMMLYAMAATYFAIKVSDGIKEAGYVLFSFLILHFSYGLGYLEGIWKFALIGQKESLERQKISR